MFFDKTTVATAMLLGILLLPIAADAQCYGNGNGTFQCGVPKNDGYFQKTVPVETYVQPAAHPVVRTNWWRKSYRYGHYFQKEYSYGSHHNYANRYNWNDWHGYNFPFGNGSGYGYGSPAMVYQSGSAMSPMGGGMYASAGPSGGGYKYPGGFKGPYANFATNDGRGAYDGPPAFDYTGYGMHDNPPTKEELNRLGVSTEIPKHYANLGTHDNPPTAAELQEIGDDSSLPKESTTLGDLSEISVNTLK